MNEFGDGFKEGFKEFGHSIAVIVNSVLLFIVYLVGVGITSIFAKLVNKHFLDTKLKNTDSYWSNLDLKKESIEKYYRQF